MCIRDRRKPWRRERRKALCTVDLWTVGCADPRLTALPRFPMGKPWKTLRVSHRLPTGRRLPTSSTAPTTIRLKSGNVKTISQPPALAYSTPVTVQGTGATALSGILLSPLWHVDAVSGRGDHPISPLYNPLIVNDYFNVFTTLTFMRLP